MCAVATAALFAFWPAMHARRWSVNLLSVRILVAFVVVTTSLFISGFARDDTEKVATWVDGRLTYAPARNPTFSNDDPGVPPLGAHFELTATP